MKRGLILILMLIVFSVSTLAVNVEINAVQNHVLKGQNAIFSVIIDNDAFEEKLFTIKSIDLNWILQDSPIVEHLGKQSKGSYELTFAPLKDLEPKIYGVSLIIISDKGDRIERFVSINLLKNEDILYIDLSPGPIDPRKPATLSFKVNNKYEISFEQLDVKLTSNFLNKEFSFLLDRKGEHIEDFVLELDPNLESGTYPVRVLIKYCDVVLNDKEINVEIGGYSKLNEIVDVSEGLLTKKEIVRKINDGNNIVQEKYEREFSLAERLFTLMKPKPDSVTKKEGYYVLTWNLEVGPGEEADIILYKNYRDPLLISLIFVLVVYFVYRWKVKAVRVRKKVMTLHTDKKDFISAMKVILNIKNMGSKTARKLKIREKIPGLSKEPKDFGILKPNSIEKVGDGVILTWEIEKLQPGEERIINYRAESKLHVLGKMVLPPTVVRYEYRNKGETSHSNKVSIRL